MDKKILDKFLDCAPENVHEVCASMWDMTSIVPFPKFDIVCSTCGCDKQILRQVSYHTRTGSPSKLRANVSFKCTKCSKVIIFGVVVPQEVWDRMGERRGFSYHDLRHFYGYE